MRVGLLSNTTWPSEFHLQEIDKFKLTEFFDAVAFSCELGEVEPDATIHHLSELPVVLDHWSRSS